MNISRMLREQQGSQSDVARVNKDISKKEVGGNRSPFLNTQVETFSHLRDYAFILSENERYQMVFCRGKT